MLDQKEDKQHADKLLMDEQKLGFDLFKHLTTLCTASILIYVTMLEKGIVVKPPGWHLAIIITSLIVSLICSLFAMGSIVLFRRATFGLRFYMVVVSLAAGSTFVFGLIAILLNVGGIKNP